MLQYKKKDYHGGFFNNEEHAAMATNLLCDKLEIERKNPTINTELNEIQDVTNTFTIH